MTRWGTLRGWVIAAISLGVMFPAPALASGPLFSAGPSSSLSSSRSYYPAGMVWGDFNGDGKYDIATTDYNTGTVTVMLGDGTGHFTPASGSPIVLSQGIGPIAMAYFNSFGSPVGSSNNAGLAVGNTSDDTVSILEGNGDGTFSAGPVLSFPPGCAPNAIATGDFNGDLVQDVAVAESCGRVQVFLGNPDGSFQAPATIALPSGGGGCSPSADAIVAGQFEPSANSNLDLAVLDDASATVDLLIGDGKGGFTAGTPIATGETGSDCSSGSAFSVARSLTSGNFAGDLDSTGDDLAVGFTDGKASILTNDGSGNYTLAAGSPVQIAPANAQIVDLTSGRFQSSSYDGIAAGGYWQGGCECILYDADWVSVLQAGGTGQLSQVAGSPYELDGVAGPLVAQGFAASLGIGGAGDDIVATDVGSCHGDDVVTLVNQGTGAGQTPAGNVFAGDGCSRPPPSATTDAAQNVGSTSATLTGTVAAGYGTPITGCQFQYGIGNFNSSTPCSPAPADGGPPSVTADLTGLTPGQSYEFRLVATSSSGTATGQTQQFRTSTPAPPPSSCPAGQKADVSNDPLEATGCFSPGPSSNTWVSTGDVRINGIDFNPSSGSVVIDLPARTLHASGSGVILLGGIVPVGGWVGRMTVDFSHTIAFVPDSGATIKGFPFDGSLEAELADGGEAKITGSVSLRLLGDDVAASLSVLTSNQDGLAGASLAVMPANADPGVFELSSCSPSKQPPLGFDCANVISPKGNAYTGLVAKQPGIVRLFGFLPVEGLSLSWDRSSDQWSFQAALAPRDIFHLGTSGTLPTLTIGGSFGWNPFRFNGASLADSSIAIPLFNVAVLDSFGFHLNLNPFGFGGNLALRAGPGLQAVQINGGVDYETKTGESGFDLKINGSWSLKGEVGVNGHVEYDSLDGAHTVIVGGGFTKSWADVVTATVNLQGGIAIPHWQLNADGNISLLGLTDIGAKGIVSDAGVGLCGEAHLLFFSGEVGFTHLWSGKTDFTGCDFSGLTTVSGGGAGDAASMGRAVTLAAHLPREEFAVVDAQAPPEVTLVGPRGQRLSTPATVDKIETSPVGLAVAVASSNTTYFIVEHPAAGRWRIIPTPSSPPPIRYEVAAPLKPLGLRVRVLGSGQRRTLRFRFNRQPGETVAFVQEGGSERTILSTTRAAGGQRFTVSAGPGGRRTIIAVVSFDGLPREQLVVARFTAPAPVRPRLTAVRYRIRSDEVIISWRHLTAIDYYDVQITFAHAVVRYRVRGAARGITVRLSQSGKLRRIIVQATNTSGITGPSTTAIRQPPATRRHHHR